MLSLRPVVILTALLAFSAACKPSVPPAANPAPESGFPATLQGFRLTDSDSIAQSDGGGRLYRYSSGRSGEWVTVFLYPIPEDIKAAPDSLQWVLIEGRKFTQIMPIQVQRGRYDAYEMAFADSQPVVSGRDTIPGFASAAATRSGGAVSLQLEYLYLVHGQFLKIRATMPEKDWQQTNAALFAQDLARLVYSKDLR